MQWKCLIVDDDLVMCELLAAYCDQADAIASAEVATSPVEALKLLEHNRYDLVFLDLNMPEISGKDLLELMPTDLPVVMVTSDAGFAVESYNYGVVGYLLKPVTLASFLKTVSRLKAEVPEPEFLFVKDGTSQVKITFAQLSHIKSESNYVTFYVGGKRIMSLMRLADLEKLLPTSFVRVHRSYIVNTQFVHNAASNHLMIGDVRIPISDSYRSKVARTLQLPL